MAEVTEGLLNTDVVILVFFFFFFFAFAVQLKVQYVVFKVFCYLRMSLSYLQREQVLLHGAAKIHSYALTVAQNGQTEHWF